MKGQKIMREKSHFSKKLTVAPCLPTTKHNRRTLKTQRGKCSLLIWKKLKKQEEKTGTNYGEDQKYDRIKTYFRKGWRSRRRKGRERKKKKEINTNKELDFITCSTCKVVFIDLEGKTICCDRCESWFCTWHVQMLLYMLQIFKLLRYCKTCKLLSKKAITKDRKTKVHRVH